MHCPKAKVIKGTWQTRILVAQQALSGAGKGSRQLAPFVRCNWFVLCFLPDKGRRTANTTDDCGPYTCVNSESRSESRRIRQ